MSVTYERLPDGSLRTAVPDPYWYKGWRTLWFWRPGCHQCRTIYKNIDLYRNHYIMNHAYEVPR